MGTDLYRGETPLRPEISNSQAVQKTLQLYAENLGTNPPFHPLGMVIMNHVNVLLTTQMGGNLDYSQCYHFRKKLRELWNKGLDLDKLAPPAAPN